MIPFLALLWACRPDLGEPSYPDPDADTSGGDTGAESLAGPDPYSDGEARLSFGIFYESGASELDPTDHFYIYESTFTIASSEERVEGYTSDVLTHSGGAWWGGGIHWDVARDLSGWSTLNLDLLAPAEGGISAPGLAMLGGSEGRISASDAGFVADGTWHHLVIPLDDLGAAGADLSQVTAPLIIVGDGGAQGDELYIDNLYLE